MKTNPTLLSGIKYDPVFSVIHGWLSKAKNVEIDVSFQKAYHFFENLFLTEKNEEKIVGYEKGEFLLKINYSIDYTRKLVMKIPSQEGMKELELHTKHTSKH